MAVRVIELLKDAPGQGRARAADHLALRAIQGKGHESRAHGFPERDRRPAARQGHAVLFQHALEYGDETEVAVGGGDQHPKLVQHHVEVIGKSVGIAPNSAQIFAQARVDDVDAVDGMDFKITIIVTLVDRQHAGQ